MSEEQSPRVLNEEDLIEEDIKAKGLTAPRITPADVDDFILSSQWHTFPGTTVVVCCITLQNGYHVTGTSAAASPENFNKEIGARISFNHAREKIWALLGFSLRDLLHKGKITDADVIT